MRDKHVRVLLEDVPWEPWDKYFPGAPPNPPGEEYGGWCKVLRKPEGGSQHYTFLLRLLPPKGKRIRWVAAAGGNEEVLLLSGSSIDETGKRTTMKDSYIFHSAGAPHAGYLDEEHLVFVSYDGGGPDVIKEFEIVD